MANLIDRDAVVAWIEKQRRLSKLLTIMMIQETPAVDAVPVVRCRDCVHYRKKADSLCCDDDTCDILYYCDGTHRTACEEDFCSYGKRRHSDD